MRVYVGLSGGVDSAVSAALLKKAGHDVTGVFIKIWQPEFIECTWREDRLDAMRVAATLGIPFKEIDLSEEYQHAVVETMVRGYEAGITPNPDVLCNEKIKFGFFLRWALENGAECVATGHYARVESRDGRHHLLRGIDQSKDQSYFLYRLGQDELARTLFPIGALEKRHVRAEAMRLNLPVADKKDSQGLCFIGDVSMPDFLGRFIDVHEGAVLDEQGATIGTHVGAAFYTLGQRHGFTTPSHEPQYVIAIDTKANTITVSPDRARANVREISITDPHWIDSTPEADTLLVQTRYREQPVQARVSRDSITFAKPHLASPGQDAVVYRSDECIGGGVIA